MDEATMKRALEIKGLLQGIKGLVKLAYTDTASEDGRKMYNIIMDTVRDGWIEQNHAGWSAIRKAEKKAKADALAQADKERAQAEKLALSQQVQDDAEYLKVVREKEEQAKEFARQAAEYEHREGQMFEKIKGLVNAKEDSEAKIEEHERREEKLLKKIEGLQNTNENCQEQIARMAKDHAALEYQDSEEEPVARKEARKKRKKM